MSKPIKIVKTKSLKKVLKSRGKTLKSSTSAENIASFSGCNKSSQKGSYSPEIFCNQLHALYDRLEKRRQEILADPDLTPDNDQLQQELEDVIRRIGLVRECFEEFCPS